MPTGKMDNNQIQSEIEKLTEGWSVLFPEKYEDDGFHFVFESSDVFAANQEVVQHFLSAGMGVDETTPDDIAEMSAEVNDEDFYYCASDDDYADFCGYESGPGLGNMGVTVAISCVSTILKYLKSTETCTFKFIGMKEGKLQIISAEVTSESVVFKQLV